MLRSSSAAFLVVLSVLAAESRAAEWPHLRGPGFDGRGQAPASLGADSPGLELAWRVPIGSGYSGIAATSSLAVTMFSQGDSDWVAAFALADGSELWRQRLGVIHEGRDGSADGPLSSPVISGDLVFALGPKGQLLALELASGEIRWSRDLEKDLGSEQPTYGFGVTPVAVGGTLVILTGVDGSAVTGLDQRSGEVVWTTGDGSYSYQVPIALTVGGRSHFVTGSGRDLFGLDPEDGAVLWRHELAEGERLGNGLTAVGDDRLLGVVGGDGAMFEIRPTESGFEARELYRTQSLGQTYALPVLHQGHLYGFRGEILTCVDAATGERRWRSRPPGGSGLILLGDYLAVLGADGQVVLADASPDGYVERARVRALDDTGYTWPSYAAGRILVRNLEEMAAVSVGRSSADGETARASAGGALGALLERLEGAEDKSALIDEFLSAHETMPIIEGDRAHFVYVGEAEDLAITGSMTPTRHPVEMRRVVGTNLYYQSFDVVPGGHWEYQFIRDYEERLVDPLNSRTAPSRHGETPMSEFSLPGYAAPSHIEARTDGVHGDLERWSFASEILGHEREVTVYLPPGYRESENDYSLLVVFDGPEWLEKGLLHHTLDNLAGNGAQPIVTAFLSPPNRWWLEAGGTGTGDYTRSLVEELVPLLEERYRLKRGPSARGLMGHTGYALAALYATLSHPDVFGKVALQSVHLSHGYEGPLMKLIAREPKAEVEIYFDWSRYELRDQDPGYELGEENRRLAAALRAAGYEYTGGEVLDSAGWAGWRSRSDRILKTLFPLR